MKNLNTTLKRNYRGSDPMKDNDRLPKEVRAWLSHARLPWSPRSVQRLWDKALRKHNGKQKDALLFLSRCEANQIKKDAPQIWGASYPNVSEI
jgi:hypothetical protein